MNRAVIHRLALLGASLILSALLAEAGWRLLLASDTRVGRVLRNPAYYADPYSEDLFWLLRHRWKADRFRPPRNPHPVLGWHTRHIGADYSHNDEGEIAGRRPVLLYGDSFAQGYPGVMRFQQILNRDPRFTRDHYLLNYGVGGYGLDQIYLLFKHSIDRFEDPFVIFSFLTHDLDRSVISVRLGQKPYFTVAGGELQLRGVPVEPRPEDFFAARPPRVGSYLVRRLGRLSFIRRLRELPTREPKKRVNGAILDAVFAELEARRLDHTILVFHNRAAFRKGPGWRSTWLRAQLDDHGADYLWSYDILRREAADTPLDELFAPANAHPTSLANQIFARVIAERVLADAARRHRQKTSAKNSSAQRSTGGSQRLNGSTTSSSSIGDGRKR